MLLGAAKASRPDMGVIATYAGRDSAGYSVGNPGLSFGRDFGWQVRFSIGKPCLQAALAAAPGRVAPQPEGTEPNTGGADR